MTSVMHRKPPAPPTAAEIDAARVTAKRFIEKARAFIVLDHPFFASIMLKRPFTERMDIPTLAVTDSGSIFYNPVFIAQQSVPKVTWAICHEILHYASGHGPRRGSRDHQKWNVAGDMWINDTLNSIPIGERIPGCLDVPGSKDRTVEDIFAGFPPDDDGDGPGDGPTRKSKSKSKGQGGGGGDGDPMGDDMLPDEDGGPSPEEIDGTRKIEVAEAAQIAKMKGKLPGVLAKFAAETIETKTPWYDILERYMTERIKQDYSWARPNRRYMPDFYLPSMDGVGAMGEVVIQVDISGSVSRQEISHYNGHIKAIVEQCRPTKVHVIYTDTKVQKHDTYDKPEDVEIQYHSGGGTHMEAGFDYIQAQGIEPEVVVTLTDGYDTYTSAPSFPTVWCVSTEQPVPYGEVVRFTLEA